MSDLFYERKQSSEKHLQEMWEAFWKTIDGQIINEIMEKHIDHERMRIVRYLDEQGFDEKDYTLIFKLLPTLQQHASNLHSYRASRFRTRPPKNPELHIEFKWER